MLQALWNPQGLQWVADVTLHYVTPALFLVDWLVFTPKGTLRTKAVAGWLIFPLGFGIYSLARGPISGFYPYPFLNAGTLGYAKVLTNMAAMSAFFLAVGWVLVLLDRLLHRRA